MSVRVRERITDFVAEVDGPALCGELTPTTVQEISAAFDTYPVLIFPRQPLAPDELACFASRIGEFGHDPFVRPLDGHAHVIEVRRRAAETTPIFGATWHSDWSFQACPPSATLLHAQIVPPFGGDTLFADAVHAFATLPEALQDELRTLRAIHSAAPSYGPKGLFAKDDPSRSMRIVISAEADQQQTHPMVRLHPRSGRAALFINHVYTVGIEGMDHGAARALLERLFAHMSDSRFVYRHRWAPQTLVMWDNRLVTHYAAGGYAGYERLMYRVTLAGEAPLPAPVIRTNWSSHDECRDYR